MNFRKGILLLVSGIIAIAVLQLLSRDAEINGFLFGYGYTAIAGGVLGILYSYYKGKQSENKKSTVAGDKSE